MQNKKLLGGIVMSLAMVLFMTVAVNAALAKQNNDCKHPWSAPATPDRSDKKPAVHMDCRR